jgi:putative aldouronate transport system substrate-binding protein
MEVLMNSKNLTGSPKRGNKRTALLALLVICLLIPVAQAWAGGSGQSSSGGTGQPTLSYWMPFRAEESAMMNSWDDNIVFQHKEKVTGVKINFISPAAGEETTAYNLMISSNDLPDMISHLYLSILYPGGPTKAVADGVFIRLNEQIEKNAPAFSKIINSNLDFKRQVTTDEGLIWGMAMLETTRQPPFDGPTIRKDWLDDLGLPMPVTMADWYNVLTQFKQKKGAVSPYVLYGDGKELPFMLAYDIDPSGWLQRDNKVVYSYTDPGFREYLTEMNKWYKEGLFHYDFTVWDTNNWLANGAAGAYRQGFWMFTLDQNMIREKDPKAYIVAAPYPTKDKNTITKIRNLSPNNRGFETVVTSSCKDPDLAVKWLDWGYTDEGYMWSNFGEEGVSYTMVNGKVQYTPFMKNNPDGFELTRLLGKYALHSGSYVRDWLIMYDIYSAEEQATLEIWNGDSSHLLNTGLLSFTPEEGNTNANIMSDINIYVNEMTLRFIKGEEPLSNWDAYVRNVRNMGIDTVVKNCQAAYDRYLKRK